MERPVAAPARTQGAPPAATTGESQGNGKLPPELRFLAAQATDPEERERIVRAYYLFAHGTPDSSAVQFTLLASALLRVNLSAAQDVADNSAKVTTAARNATVAANMLTQMQPPASAEEITDAVRQALGGLAGGLNQLSDQVSRQAGGWWTGAALVLIGVCIGYLVAKF